MRNILNTIINKDIPRIGKIDISEIEKLEKMIVFIGKSEIDGINYTSLSNNLKITKYKAEQEVLKYSDRLPVTIIRPPAVFGPRDTEILVYFQTFSKGLNSVIGLKEKYLSLIYIEDLIDGIMLAAEILNNSGEIYFISSDKAYSWNDIGNITSKLLGKKAIKIKIPHSVVFGVGYIAQFFSTFSKNAATLNVEKCKDITRERWVCSNQKAKDKLGFIEKHTLEESFAKTIDWYKRNNWIKN